MEQADHYYINRLVKTILWMKGGFKIYVSGDEGVFNYLKKAYSADGEAVLRRQERFSLAGSHIFHPAASYFTIIYNGCHPIIKIFFDCAPAIEK